MTADDDIGRSTARAVSWAFIATTGAKIITLVSLTLLARLLAPREFGLLAFALAYIVYVETIADLGTGTALIYWPDRRDDAAQVTFIVNLAAGVFWCVLTFLLAPFIADFFNAPQGTPIVRALSFTFLIKHLGNTHDALARKDLRFRAAAVPELSAAAVKMAVALVLAWRGFGAWSLVWAHLAGVVAWTVLFWVVTPWRPTVRFPVDLFGPMLAYGRGIIFINVLAAFQYQTDLVVISRWWGMTALGLYQLAGKIPEATVAMIYRVAGRVLLPAFSRSSAAGTSPNQTYLAAARYVGAVTLPAACGLAILAKPFVLFFFGPKWVDAAPIVSALAILAGIRAFASNPGDALKAVGRVGLLARLGFIRVAAIVAAILIAVRWGPLAVAVSLVVVDGAALLLYVIAAARAMDVSLRAIGRAYAPSLTATAMMSVVLLAWLQWGPALVMPFNVIVPLVVGAVTYLIVLHIYDPKILMEARWMFFSRPSASPR